MAARYNSISDITPDTDSWTLLVRIVRLWSVSSFGKVKLPYSQEMILMDDKGDKIHATMKRELIYKLGKGLKENSVYAMSTFKVDVNDGTKLIFNPDIPEAVELKKRMSASGSPSLGLTQLQESPKVSIEEELISLTPRLTIKGLNECQEELNYVVLATVTSIREEGWWYTACDCNKKVYPDSDMYFCPQCNRHVLNVTPRYRIKLTVDDGTSSTTFVLFESDARALLKKSCAEMIGSNNMVNANLTIPAEILALIDKTYLFKVSNDLESMVAQSYMVKRVSNDPAILHSFKEKVLLEGTMPTGGSPNGIDYSNAAITQDLLPKFSETTVEGQAGCSGAEGVVIYIPDELTPAKRACPDGDPNSASSVSSKIPKHDIKVEKD